MSTAILQCNCGAKVRVPSDAGGRFFRCPKCRATLTAVASSAPSAIVAPATPAVVSSQPLPTGSGADCPICQTLADNSDAVVTCDQCDQVHHQECWTEIGGCGTYGCANAPAIDKSEVSPATPLSAWGDTKKCPACGETIKAIALRCRYCHTDFPGVDPLSVSDLHTQVQVTKTIASAKSGVIAVFVISIVGILAPLMLIISLLYVVSRKDQLAKAGPLFVIMGWSAVGLSALYSLLMLAFILAS